MVHDDHSEYKWLFAYPSTDAVNAAASLIDWWAAFCDPRGFMPDGPAHFKNHTLSMLSKLLCVKHDFMLPYIPWSNGAVERLGKKLLRTFRVVLSELQLRPEG